MSQRFGVFNATVRSRVSYAFNDFIQGEVIPVNTPAPHPDGARGEAAYLGGHFSRERDADDDRLGMGLDASVLAQQLDENNYLAVDGKKEPVVLRPTLFYFEIKLRHANAASGRINIFYVPSDKKELERFKDRLDEGAINEESDHGGDEDADYLKPLVSAEFTLRPESAPFTGLVLTGVEALAQQASAFLDLNANYFRHLAGDKASAAAQRAEGSLVLRLFSEHEFALFLQLPALAADGSAVKEGRHDHVWVHAYTKPNKLVYGARGELTSVWTKYMMPLFLLYTLVMQGMMGSKEGKEKREAQRRLQTVQGGQTQEGSAQASIKNKKEGDKEKPSEQKEKKEQ
ncbi:hypothetical protein STCU_00210 [Strigomonas culicis]|uniref:Uncharacterized protein n=1 Tax=Strigomonas culicis TaxID=28005 RepID=S9V208_9TRYP|nr:hypothetical protein STCU_00210 [Strigomonas culicis]|eukprot:EPY37087.1 hypothetical protein STCU_00210 [Strigomonas culicis]